MPNPLPPVPLDPLPFRLGVPGHDAVDGLEVVSISVKVEGLAYWAGGVLTLEWSETQHIDEVSFAAVRSDVVTQPPLAVDIEANQLSSALFKGGWWRPRIELRARYLNVFGDVPGSKPGRLLLRIARRDRALARLLVSQLTEAIANPQLSNPADQEGLAY